jgi:hypothetical protein
MERLGSGCRAGSWGRVDGTGRAGSSFRAGSRPSLSFFLKAKQLNVQIVSSRWEMSATQDRAGGRAPGSISCSSVSLPSSSTR